MTAQAEQQRQYHLDDEALNDIVRKVEDAWFAILRPGPTPWPVKVFGTYMIVEDEDGLARVEYTAEEDDGVRFGEITRVEQVFVAARDPNSPQSKHPLRRAMNLMEKAARAGIDGLRAKGFHSSPGEGGQESGQTSQGSPDPSDLEPMSDGDAIFMQAPLTIYSDNDERYVGGVVLEPGSDNAYGDVWEAEDIRIMSQRFMEGSQHMDWMHTTKMVAKPVESVYFPTVEEGGQATYKFWDEDIQAGSWWLGSRVTDAEAWGQVKRGELTGFSIFAIKGAGDSSGNRKYAKVGGPAVQAPEGRKMSHKDWEITMVALVDAPAVRKATYVTMRRAPSGKGVAYSDQTGIDLPEPVVSRVSRLLYDINQADPQGDVMKKIANILAYAAEADAQLAEQEESEAAAVASIDGAPATTEPPAEPTETLDPEGTSMDGPTGTPEPDEGPTLASISKQITDFVGDQPGLIDQKIQDGLAPLDARIKLLEQRSNRMSANGALPGQTGLENEEEEYAGSKRFENDWVNYGTKPSKPAR